VASEPLTHDEARRLVEVAAQIGTPYTRKRDAAAFAVLYRCGVRSNEARMMELRDLTQIDDATWILRVRHPKGGKGVRELGVDRGTREYLGGWLHERGPAPGPLFCTPAGDRVETRHWRRKIASAARGAGIAKRVHCHGLRHTFARMLLDEGVNMRVIQQCLGHRDLGTTATYLASVGSPEAVAATVGRDW